MIVSAVQCDVSAPEKIAQMIGGNAGSDLYVLPEMWNTGFTVNPQTDAIAETEARAIMARLAAEQGCAVAGSMAVRSRRVAESQGHEAESEEFRNRFFFAEPDGTISHYDKHHLFSLAKEDRTFVAGQQRTVVNYCGMRIMLLVCYDLRFPVWSRCNEDYDCILYVANWPTLRIETWRTLLRARAMENQCYVVGVNRTGGLFGGRSTIIDPYGTVIKEASADKEEVISADLSMEPLLKLRKKFPVLRDRDEVEIKRLKN